MRDSSAFRYEHTDTLPRHGRGRNEVKDDVGGVENLFQQELVEAKLFNLECEWKKDRADIVDYVPGIRRILSLQMT